MHGGGGGITSAFTVTIPRSRFIFLGFWIFFFVFFLIVLSFCWDGSRKREVKRVLF